MGASEKRLEQIEIRERPNGFVMVLWFILLLVFATFLALTLIGAWTVILSGDGIGKLGHAIGAIISLKGSTLADFANSSPANGGAVVALLGIPATVVVGLLLRAVERTGRRIMLTPLVPVAKRKFIASEEGLVTLQFRNLYTRSGWYRLRPWDSLIFNGFDEKRLRISLRDKRSTMYLKMSAKGEEARSITRP